MILERLLRVGEGRTIRRLKGIADAVDSIEDDYTELTDAELQELTDNTRSVMPMVSRLTICSQKHFATAREAATPRAWPAPFRCPAHGRCRVTFRQYRGDENR